MNLSIPWSRISWRNTSFLVGTHLVALLGTAAYVIFHGPTLGAAILALAFFVACGMSITAGYHRLFSHATYKAHPVLRALYLIFGAAAFENSALKWSADHRRHHRYVDEDDDPYSIRKGFWWAHMGWVFLKEPPSLPGGRVRDLERDPLVMLQHRYYVHLAIVAGVLLPLGIGFLIGDPIGGLVLAGFLRIVVGHHATFCVNSVAHTIGKQPYSDANSSRDHVLTALITMGEGYHNFHHAFPSDYRNGVRPYQFDPTKWAISGFTAVGLARDRVRVPAHVILKARLRMDERRSRARLDRTPLLEEHLRTLRENLEEILDRWTEGKKRLAELRGRVEDSSREALRKCRAEIREARRDFRAAYQMWSMLMRRPEILLATVEARSR